MRRIIVGFFAITGVALATPALAQGVYIGPGGVGFDVSPGYRGGYYGGEAPGYVYGSGPGYAHGPGYAYENYEPGYRQCRMVRIQTPSGNIRRVRRCY